MTKGEIMNERMKIPDQFYGVFQSKNRLIYIDALILIYEEYLYNDYYLSKETCLQLLTDQFNRQSVNLVPEGMDGELDNMSQPIANRIFSKLIQFKWLRKVEDYTNFKTNVVIPDYASIFIEAFRKISNPDENITDLYIQNVYTNIYSFYHDKKAGIELLKTARYNTSNLNRALQNMLHNMDKFFESLLQQDRYENLLEDHLYGYVEAIVDKKYGLLKTSDNFYIYKNDIKKLLKDITEDEERLYILKQKMLLEGKVEEDVDQEIDEIIESVERGISNMERRIAHIDREHSRYVRATVRRLEYLLNHDDNMTGNMIKLLNLMKERPKEDILNQVAAATNLHDHTILSEHLLYKKRGKNKKFEETLVKESVADELTREEILRLNQKKLRFTKDQIESFITSNITNGVYRMKDHPIETDEQFQLLILAYDYSLRKKSPFQVISDEDTYIEHNGYTYPDLRFQSK